LQPNDILFACKLLLVLTLDLQVPILCIDKNSIFAYHIQIARDKKMVARQVLTHSFPSEELARQTWLQPVFRAEQVQLYQVTGCNQP
jgi:hypothetical protein